MRVRGRLFSLLPIIGRYVNPTCIEYTSKNVRLILISS